MSAGRESRTRSRWLSAASWAVGVIAIACVVVVAVKRGEAEEFARLARSIQPMWLVAAAVLQAGTYACDAQIWRRVLLRCGHSQPFGRLFRFSIARLFVSQAVPSGGLSGDFVVVRALETYGAPLDALMTALAGNLFGFYAAFAACAFFSAAVFFAHGLLRGPILGIAVPFVVIATAVPAPIALLIRTGASAKAARCPRVPLLRQTLAAFGRATPPIDVLAAFTLASAAELVGPVPGGLGALEGGPDALPCLPEHAKPQPRPAPTTRALTPGRILSTIHTLRACDEMRHVVAWSTGLFGQRRLDGCLRAR